MGDIRGVTWNPQCGKWRARFYSCGRRWEAGTYATAEAAARELHECRAKFCGLFEKAVLWIQDTKVDFALKIRAKIFVDGESVQGSFCYFGPRKAPQIEIARWVDEPIDVLLHEAAHALAASRHGWPGPDHAKQHDHRWGKCYSEIYRDYFEWKALL